MKLLLDFQYTTSYTIGDGRAHHIITHIRL
jgi:hypothetical protein